MEILGETYFGNTVQQYAIFLGIFLGSLILFKLFLKIALNRLHKLAAKTSTQIDDALIRVVKTANPPFYLFVSFYFSLQFIQTPPIVQKVLYSIFVLWVVYQAILAAQILIDYVTKDLISKRVTSSAASAVVLLGKLAKGILWVLGALFILSNYGINVSSLVAGLGIGGIAVALALQNILTDLFSSFSIYFDRPFEVGDFIVVGEHRGIVEKIGIKTSRIRALQGEELVISNRELTSTRIQNFKKMTQRRAVFKFGVLYETPRDKLEKIPELLKNIVEAKDQTTFSRSHFVSFAESSLDFELVYFVESGDYTLYMDINQKVLFEINQVFAREGISMAYPTRTLYVNKEA